MKIEIEIEQLEDGYWGIVGKTVWPEGSEVFYGEAAPGELGSWLSESLEGK